MAKEEAGMRAPLRMNNVHETFLLKLQKTTGKPLTGLEPADYLRRHTNHNMEV